MYFDFWKLKVEYFHNFHLHDEILHIYVEPYIYLDIIIRAKLILILFDFLFHQMEIDSIISYPWKDFWVFNACFYTLTGII